MAPIFRDAGASRAYFFRIGDRIMPFARRNEKQNHGARMRPRSHSIPPIARILPNPYIARLSTMRFALPSERGIDCGSTSRSATRMPSVVSNALASLA
ncbi:MAG: hypothetical protein BWZ10_00805 [candidate division BRC1 bacterium ADurb.BinA364]|nr:MAG: hypothetical protein BWZ10_00805 [candidate division BRC1 bacterium ADurb.BinA364]